MAVNLSPVGGVAAQFFDNNGVILSGGKIYTYAAGTTTDQATYTSAAGNTAHTNPIILDSAGRVPSGELWLTDGENYKFVLKNALDVLIGTYDNVTGINGTGIASDASNVSYTASYTNAVTTTVQNKLSETVSVKDFGAVGDGVTDDTTAIQNAITSSYGKTLFFPKGTYVSSDLSVTQNIKFLGESDSILFYKSSGTAALVSVTGTSTNFASENLTYDGNYLGQTNTVYSIKFSSAGLQSLPSSINLTNNIFTNGNYADVTIGTSATFPDTVIVEIVNNTFIDGIEGTAIKDVRALNISSACNVTVTGNYFGFGRTPSTYGRAGIVSWISGYSGSASRGNFSNNIFHNMGRSSAASNGVLGALDCYADAVNLTIVGNSVINPYGRGIQLKSNASNVVISSNSVDGLIDLTGGVAVDAQITVNRSTTTTVYGNLLISNNVCKSSGWDGMSISTANIDYSGFATPIEISNNLILNAARRGVGLYQTDNAIISNNIIDTGCTDGGIYLNQNVGQINVIGNSVRGTTGSAFYASSNTGGIFVNNNYFTSTSPFSSTLTNCYLANNFTTTTSSKDNYLQLFNASRTQFDFTDTLANQTINSLDLPAGSYQIIFEGLCTAAASGGLYLSLTSSATVSLMKANSQVWNGTSLVYSTQQSASSGTPSFDMCAYSNQVTNYKIVSSFVLTNAGTVYLRAGIDVNNATPTSIYPFATMQVTKIG